jgi:hypothetical protein
LFTKSSAAFSANHQNNKKPFLFVSFKKNSVFFDKLRFIKNLWFLKNFIKKKIINKLALGFLRQLGLFKTTFFLRQIIKKEIKKYSF